MANLNQDATVYGGDDARLELTLLDRDGTPLDLTGATLTWGMAPRRSSDAALTKTSEDASEIEITDAVAGRAIVKLLADDTDDLSETVYLHELKITDATGKTETLLTGTLTVRSSILD
jgi:hypothetical protein